MGNRKRPSTFLYGSLVMYTHQVWGYQIRTHTKSEWNRFSIIEVVVLSANQKPRRASWISNRKMPCTLLLRVLRTNQYWMISVHYYGSYWGKAFTRSDVIRSRPSGPRDHTNCIYTRYDHRAPAIYHAKFGYNMCSRSGGVRFWRQRHLFWRTFTPPQFDPSELLKLTWDRLVIQYSNVGHWTLYNIIVLNKRPKRHVTLGAYGGTQLAVPNMWPCPLSHVTSCLIPTYQRFERWPLWPWPMTRCHWPLGHVKSCLITDQLCFDNVITKYVPVNKYQLVLKCRSMLKNRSQWPGLVHCTPPSRDVSIYQIWCPWV